MSKQSTLKKVPDYNDPEQREKALNRVLTRDKEKIPEVTWLSNSLIIIKSDEVREKVE
jgi:hypothetical protein